MESSSDQLSLQGPPGKRRRVALACDVCRTRKSRVGRASEDPRAAKTSPPTDAAVPSVMVSGPSVACAKTWGSNVPIPLLSLPQM
jgi:hypothetical protein